MATHHMTQPLLSCGHMQCLHMLGHQLTFATSCNQLKQVASPTGKVCLIWYILALSTSSSFSTSSSASTTSTSFPPPPLPPSYSSSSSSLHAAEPVFDVLYTDYLGMFGVRDAGLFAPYKCRIRLLDSFGTEPLCMLL